MSDDFGSAEPPLIRGGNESVYQVRTVGAVAASWPQAARFAVGRLGIELRRRPCRRGAPAWPATCSTDGTVRFATEMAVSVKLREDRR